MSEAEPTIFSKIVSGEIPADVVYDSERVLAFATSPLKRPCTSSLSQRPVPTEM